MEKDEEKAGFSVEVAQNFHMMQATRSRLQHIVVYQFDYRISWPLTPVPQSGNEQKANTVVLVTFDALRRNCRLRSYPLPPAAAK